MVLDINTKQNCHKKDTIGRRAEERGTFKIKNIYT